MSDQTEHPHYVTDSADEAYDGPLSGDGEHPHATEHLHVTGHPHGAAPAAAGGGHGDRAEAEPGAEAAAEAEEAFDVADAALADAEQQRDEYLDTLRHLQADFENYKKRVAKQQVEQFERAAEHLVVRLLPVLDTADLAIAHSAGEETGQIRTALLETLGKEGLERIAPEGGTFDPTLHDAVAHEPGEGGEQQVAELLRAGYVWNGRVLRPAMVKVKG